MFIPILNSSFFLFTTKYYARWFYMPSLILSLLSIKCIEENLSIKAGIITSFFNFISNGFNSKIDEIEKVDNGLIAIKINKGLNNVKFTYYPPGLKLGLILTIVSFIILLSYIFLNNKSLIYKKIFSVFYKKQSLL